MDTPSEPPDDPGPEPLPVVIPEGVPITGPNFGHGPFCILAIETDRPAEDDDVHTHHLICPDGGWETAQQAVNWLMHCGLKERGGKRDLPGSVPWLGMRFEILALRDQPSFMQFCSW